MGLVRGARCRLAFSSNWLAGALGRWSPGGSGGYGGTTSRYAPIEPHGQVKSWCWCGRSLAPPHGGPVPRPGARAPDCSELRVRREGGVWGLPPLPLYVSWNSGLFTKQNPYFPSKVDERKIFRRLLARRPFCCLGRHPRPYCRPQKQEPFETPVEPPEWFADDPGYQSGEFEAVRVDVLQLKVWPVPACWRGSTCTGRRRPRAG